MGGESWQWQTCSPCSPSREWIQDFVWGQGGESQVWRLVAPSIQKPPAPFAESNLILKREKKTWEFKTRFFLLLLRLPFPAWPAWSKILLSETPDPNHNQDRKKNHWFLWSHWFQEPKSVRFAHFLIDRLFLLLLQARWIHSLCSEGFWGPFLVFLSSRHKALVFAHLVNQESHWVSLFLGANFYCLAWWGKFYFMRKKKHFL